MPTPTETNSRQDCVPLSSHQAEDLDVTLQTTTRRQAIAQGLLHGQVTSDLWRLRRRWNDVHRAQPLSQGLPHGVVQVAHTREVGHSLKQIATDFGMPSRACATGCVKSTVAGAPAPTGPSHAARVLTTLLCLVKHVSYVEMCYFEHCVSGPPREADRRRDHTGPLERADQEGHHRGDQSRPPQGV